MLAPCSNGANGACKTTKTANKRRGKKRETKRKRKTHTWRGWLFGWTLDAQSDVQRTTRLVVRSRVCVWSNSRETRAIQMIGRSGRSSDRWETENVQAKSKMNNMDSGVSPPVGSDVTLVSSWCVWDVSALDTRPLQSGAAKSDEGGETVVLRTTVTSLRQLWALMASAATTPHSIAIFRPTIRPTPDDALNVRGGVWVRGASAGAPLCTRLTPLRLFPLRCLCGNFFPFFFFPFCSRIRGSTRRRGPAWCVR